ncbi:MAG: hypothetical protein Q4D65_05315 [Peptostreptococcaceae bacterium]|nr:hypothetical protein [Peptostreptococcaceae bacterium]
MLEAKFDGICAQSDFQMPMRDIALNKWYDKVKEVGKEAMMAGKKLRSIRNYLYREGRALDVARWSYHFEDGSADDVLKALAVYRNYDGGFAHGLAPENQSKDSNPLAVWAAISFLREIDFAEGSMQILRKIFKYLEQSMEDGIWQAKISAESGAPSSAKNQNAFGYYPTAQFLGVILRFEEEEKQLYQRAIQNLSEMLQKIYSADYQMKSCELIDFLNLYRDLQAAGKTHLLPDDFESFLKTRLDATIERNKENYREDKNYTPPIYFIIGKKDFAYFGNEEICSFYARYVEDIVTEHGYWDIQNVSKESPIGNRAIRDLRSRLIVDNMLFIERIVKPFGVIS